MHHKLQTQLRPDNKIRVRVDGAWTTQVVRAAADLARTRRLPVLVMLSGDLDSTVDLFVEAGFEMTRRETNFRLPVRAALANLPEPVAPDEYRIISAADADIGELHRLDELLRMDIPGSAGWRMSLQEFRRYTFDPSHFNSRTYLVAENDIGEAYLGLARVWIDSERPRLGMVGVVAGHRRRGIASLLLAHALSATAEVTGADSVDLEIDDSNQASLSLFISLGAEAVGSTTEVVFTPPPERK